MTVESAKSALRMGAAASMVLFPVLLIVAFALHYSNLSEFFEFELRYVQAPIEDTIALFLSGEAGRDYIWPHLIGYFSVPVMIGASLALGIVLFRRAPWYAVIGSVMTVTGAVFLGGVFAAWLSFAALGNLAADQADAAVAALRVLTEMQGPLAMTTYLSVLVFLGFMVSAVGLYRARIVPTWSPVALFLGNVTVMAFMDIDNLMLVGAALMLAGLVPVARLLVGGAGERTADSEGEPQSASVS